MSTLPQPPPTLLQPPTLPVYRFTVGQYQRLIESGLLKDSENVELLEGLIVPKMTRNARHDLALELADEQIRPVLPPKWRLRVQSAIETADSMPEPDIAVVRGHARSRRGRHPLGQDIGMLLEIADTSLDRDRNEKGRLYAHARIERYWILNLIEDQLEVYSDPTGPVANPRYQQRRDFKSADVVPIVLDGVEIGQIKVADLLP